MALILHSSGVQPLGQFDGYVGAGATAEYLGFKGGEVATWRGMAYPAAGAADVNIDGYVTEAQGKVVPAISANWTGILADTPAGTVHPPFFLTDDGVSGYGTLFGSVVGGAVGSQTSGTVLGPHTSTGSGKTTVWDKPGLYGVTLDAVDTANLTPTTAGITVGMPLYFTGTGLLTTNSGTKPSGAVPVAHLASFENTGGLVQTPSSLVQALNSPSGSVSSVQALKMTQVVFWYGGAAGML